MSHHRVLDISCNTGVLLVEFYFKFYDALEESIPDIKKRRRFIIKNLLYAFTIKADYLTGIRQRPYNCDCFGNVYNYSVLTKSGLDANIFIKLIGNKLYIFSQKERDYVEMRFDVVYMLSIN